MSLQLLSSCNGFDGTFSRCGKNLANVVDWLTVSLFPGFFLNWKKSVKIIYLPGKVTF